MGLTPNDDPDSRNESILSGWVRKRLQSLWLVGVLHSFMACPGSLLSSHGEKHPNPKSVRDLDQDKSRYTTSCRGSETKIIFLLAFSWIFIPNP